MPWLFISGGIGAFVGQRGKEGAAGFGHAAGLVGGVVVQRHGGHGGDGGNGGDLGGIFGGGLGKAGGKADCATCAHGRERAHGGDCGVAVDAEKDCVGRCGEVFEARDGRQAAEGAGFGVDRMDGARKAHALRLGNDLFTPSAAANDSDGAGAEETVERARHGAHL